MKTYITLIVLVLLTGCATTSSPNLEERISTMTLEEAQAYLDGVKSCVAEAKRNGESIAPCYD